jgi:hypothetical protein
MVGGILEYSSLLLGYRSLLIVIAVLYACAFLLGQRHLSTSPHAEVAEQAAASPASA